MRLASLWPTLLFALPLTAQYEARTPEFRVVSWAGPEVAQQAATQLERSAALFARLGYRRLEQRLPLTVLLLPGMADLASYLQSPQRPDASRGLSFIGRDGAYIVLAWEAPGSPWTALAHEYAHLADPERDGAAWFREGFAEYLSLLRPDENGEPRATAAPHHIRELVSGEWIPLDELLSAAHRGDVFRRPLFYAQSWLIVDWLASQSSSSVGLREAAFRERSTSLGPAAVEVQLRAHASKLELAEAVLEPAPEPAALAVRPLEAWEEPFWRAELFRALERWDDAELRFDALAADYPRLRTLQASRGALAMDLGRYDEAEELLGLAVQAPDAAWRTHHRYALLLLRHGGGEPRLRAEKATIHAELALAPSLADPNVRLTLAQARMAAERWNEAARALRSLASEPGWSGRAAAEYRELLRRRQQATMDTPRPALAASEQEADATLSAMFPVIPLPQPPRAAWPPPGTRVLSGKIAAVNCLAGGDKVVVLENPLFSFRFREPAERPARLIFPPLQWSSLPCGTYGWPVNIAYRPHRRGTDGTRGELVAVLF